MVIGAETFSPDHGLERSRALACCSATAPARLSSRPEDGNGDNAIAAFSATDLHSDGATATFFTSMAASRRKTPGIFGCRARRSSAMPWKSWPKRADAALEKLGLTGEDVDWIVPHQANLRIIKAHRAKDGRPMDRVIVTVQDHGNTSAASIPLALSVGAIRARSSAEICWLPRRSAADWPGVRWFCAGKANQTPFQALILTRKFIPPILQNSGGRDMSQKTLTRMDLSEAVFREVGLSRMNLRSWSKAFWHYVGRSCRRRERQNLVLRHLLGPRQGRPCRSQPQDRRRKFRSIPAAC